MVELLQRSLSFFFIVEVSQHMGSFIGATYFGYSGSRSDSLRLGSQSARFSAQIRDPGVSPPTLYHWLPKSEHS